MLHFASRALLGFVFAIIVDLRVADASTIPPDFHLSQSCADCSLLIEDNIKADVNFSISIEATAHHLAACEYYQELYCVNPDDSLSALTETELVEAINDQLGSKAPSSKISEYQDKYQENSGCTYFTSKLRDPKRVREECNDVEPGSENLESFGVLTITTVSTISFVLLSGLWLLLRSFRNWRLQNMILRDKTIATSQIRKSRRRSSRPIRG